MPGMTAFVGLMDIGQPKPGETVVVSAASGAVGSVVGQLARIKGCRAVGIAGGGTSATTWSTSSASTPASTTSAADLVRALRAALPKGIDIYFENVGGEVFAAVLPQHQQLRALPLCGMISQYNATGDPRPRLGPLLVKRAAVKGFIVIGPSPIARPLLQEVPAAVKAGRSNTARTSSKGIENAPRPSSACSRARTSASSWCRSPGSDAALMSLLCRMQ